MSKYYISYIKNKEILLESASGGVFTALSEYVLNRGGIVFGVSEDESSHTVYTTYADSADTLGRFRGSKYFQSHVQDAFRKVKSFLMEGKPVLFSGTPCQNAGLISYLQIEKTDQDCLERLITVDVLCHGISNEHVLKEYINSIEKKYGKKVLSLEFRNKEKGWRKSSRMRIGFEGDTCYSRFWKDDPYYLGFNCNLTLRPSCHMCDFACGVRCTDFSIGDYWGVEDKKTDPEQLHDGIGLTLVNTPKAEKIWDSEEFRKLVEYKEITRTEGIRRNGALIAPPPVHPGRPGFFADLGKVDFERNIKDHLKKEILKMRVKSVFGVEAVRKVDYSKFPLKSQIRPINPELVLNNGIGEVSNAQYNGAEQYGRQYKEKVPVLYERKEHCFGCYACVNACPTNAISMKCDEEGFFYPVIDAKTCVRCRKCEKTCPKKDRP